METLENSDWIKLIQPSGSDWESRRIDSPVVKVVHKDGSFQYGVMGALITPQNKEPYVTRIDYEVSESGVPSCILGRITLPELITGEIKMRTGQTLKIEFDRLASDEKHKKRKWSYWF